MYGNQLEAKYGNSSRNQEYCVPWHGPLTGARPGRVAGSWASMNRADCLRHLPPSSQPTKRNIFPHASIHFRDSLVYSLSANLKIRCGCLGRRCCHRHLGMCTQAKPRYLPQVASSRHERSEGVLLVRQADYGKGASRWHLDSQLHAGNAHRENRGPACVL
jgi:hypothetical protein